MLFFFDTFTDGYDVDGLAKEYGNDDIQPASCCC
jgi:hypothetical protein